MLIIRIITLTILFTFLATLPNQPAGAAITNAGSQFSCFTVSQIPQIECQALVTFYESTNGPGWIDDVGWLVSNTPCNWHGVGCKGGHVIALSFNKNGSVVSIDEHTSFVLIHYPSGIIGEIPSKIEDLSHLTILEINFSELTGAPVEIGNLNNLTTLDLSFNNLTTIPSDIGLLSNLNELGLAGNELSTLPSQIGNLANLKSLDLSLNMLSDIPAEIGNLENLETLNINSNHLSAIPTEIGDLNKLTNLILGSNRLTTISSNVGSLVNLTALYLASNRLTTLPSEIDNLINLTTLHLNANRLGTIPSEITKLTNLEKLDIAYNSIVALNENQREFFNELDSDWSVSQTIAPTGLSMESLDDSIIELAWSPIAFTGQGGYYEVSMATDDLFETYSLVIGEEANSYIIENFVPNTTYFFRIRTYRHPHAGANTGASFTWDDQTNALWSGYSEVISFTPNVEPSPPLPPPPCLPSDIRVDGSSVEAPNQKQSTHVLLPIIMNNDRMPSEPLERLGISQATLVTRSNPTAISFCSDVFFMVTFEEGKTPPDSTFRIWITDDGQPTVMHDDGSNGDLNAGDGIYTAKVFLTNEEKTLLTRGRTALERAQVLGSTVDQDKELMIRDTSVVNDEERTFDLCGEQGNPDGVWAFKKLIMDMADTGDEAVAANFVENWWQHWSREITLSNEKRAGIRSEVVNTVLNRWTHEDGRLDLDAAPFRLLAIVPRLDLRDNPTPTSGNAGEFRFVWGVLDPDDPCKAQRFTIIFEYVMQAQNTTQILGWAKQIHGLQEFDFGPDYNAALEAISSQITRRNAQPIAPNGSAIKQIRTNEFLDSPWELREFVLSANSLLPSTATRPLVLATVKQTPDSSFNNTSELADFINNNTDELLHVDSSSGLISPIHQVSDDRLAAKIQAFLNGTSVWQSNPINDNEARHQFALMTCNGCHTLETGTSFLHIEPRENSASAALSDFLTGGTVSDPISAQTRTFNDLERRQNDLLRILHSTRFEVVGVEGLSSRIH